MFVDDYNRRMMTGERVLYVKKILLLEMKG